MTWTTEQKVFIFEAYYRQKSTRKAQLQFKNSLDIENKHNHAII